MKLASGLGSSIVVVVCSCLNVSGQFLQPGLKKKIDSTYFVYTRLQDATTDCSPHTRRTANLETTVSRFFTEHGFPGYEQVGPETSDRFCMLLRFCESIPLRSAVLANMKQEVYRRNANGVAYANLLDELNVSTGRPQVYGTQVEYICGQIRAKELVDAENVNKRRAEIGLDNLEIFLKQVETLLARVE